ncbi:glycosyltransferase family 4 protein [bacterium]|nr:glycosyltransferase family 4 protein [bacterium]
MNIYYIGSPQLFAEGASSIHVSKMCEAFSEQGHNLELILPIEDKNIDSFFKYYNIQKEFKINSTIGFKKGPLRHFFHGVLSFIKILLVKNYDFIITRNITFAYLASFIKSNLIVDIHHPPVNLLSKIAIARFISSNNVIKVTCNSEGTFENIKKNINSSKKLQVLHNGVNLETFKSNKDLSSFKKNLKIPDKRVVSYVGNTYEGRGIEKIVELSKVNMDIFFLIVGGEDEDNINYIKKLKPGQKNILFTGHVNNIDIPNFLAISDVLLIPYDSDFTIKGGSKASEYSSPIKLFEYLASGKPIIASNLPAISKILSNEKDCLLVNPDSFEDLNAALNKLMDDDDLIDTISQNSLKLSKHFTWENRAKKMVSGIL